MMFRYLLVFSGIPILACAQKTPTLSGLNQVHLKKPVEVTLRLDNPVPQAEYRLIVENQMVAYLDSFSLSSLLHHPKVYFAALYPSSHNSHQLAPPITRGLGLYPFNDARINIEKLTRNHLYTRKESARSYNTWLMRKAPSDFGINSQVNTLPNVDSVRVVYMMK